MIGKKRIGIMAAAGLAVLFAHPVSRRPAGFPAAAGGPRPSSVSFRGEIAMLVIGFVALVLLLTRKMKNSVKVPLLLLSTFLYGISANLPVKLFSKFSMHPSPICSVAKAILYGFRMPMIVTLAVILLLTIVGPKLFCGWVCPVGAVQELIAMWADKLGIRRRKWKFRFTQGVRAGIFLLFVFLSGTAVIHTVQDGRVIPLAIYDYINAFHGFEIGLQPTVFGNIIHFLPFILTLAFAFVVYRPFCYLVCPIGLLAISSSSSEFSASS